MAKLGSFPAGKTFKDEPITIIKSLSSTIFEACIMSISFIGWPKDIVATFTTPPQTVHFGNGP